MLLPYLKGWDIVLVSQSPRRRQLLGDLGLPYRVASSTGDEVYPTTLEKEEIPIYLSRQKAEHNEVQLGPHTLIIAADTIVWHQGQVLGKPANVAEAKEMLSSLAGQVHKVITGVTLRDLHRTVSFSSETEVEFVSLTSDEIDYYVDHFCPLDKAGAYGIQEWIGMMGVKRIVGCYYNVMGLPVPQLYKELKNWKSDR